MFVLYISHYLTFALHFVGQGPVSMYNNFIYAKGFPQHFNGFPRIHTLLNSYCTQSVLRVIDVSPCLEPPRPAALSGFAIKTLKPPLLLTVHPIRLRKTSVDFDRLCHKTITKRIPANKRHLGFDAVASTGSRDTTKLQQMIVQSFF